MRKPKIYALVDLRDDAVRYVGASRDLVNRMAKHRSGTERSSVPLREWIAGLDAIGKPVILRVLEEPEDWEEAEQRWIARCKEAGADLFNRCKGGRGTPGVVRSEATCARIAAAKRGKPRPDLADRNRRSAILTADQVATIRSPDWKRGDSARLAREYGVSVALVCMIRHNKRRS